MVYKKNDFLQEVADILGIRITTPVDGRSDGI